MRARCVKSRLFAVVALAALWLFVLLTFLQHASPVVSSPTARASAALRDVVINEVAWAGTIGNYNHEWIELKNNTSFTVNLFGWQLKAADGTPSIVLTKSIPPNGYFLLARTNYTNVVDVPADMIYTGALGDTSEALTLTNELSNVIDTANGNGGGWPAGTDGTGTPQRATMERINPLAADADDNWDTNDGIIRNGHDAGGNEINGTPKQPNSATPAELSIVKSAPGAVLVNQPITYTLMFGNAGGKSATGVVITDTLPISVTFVTQTSSFPFTQTDQTLAWQIGALSSYSGALSLTIVVTPETGLTGWLTNTVVITSDVADYRSDNNTFTVATQIVPESADVSVSKSAPVSVTAGSEITYAITISNVGQLTATSVRVTDTLPISVAFARQSAPYTIARDGRTLTWDVGDVLTSDAPISWTVTGLVDIHFAGTMTNIVKASTTADDWVIENNSAQASASVAPPPPVVLISGVLYEGYQLGQEDEAIQLINVGPLPVNLKNYIVTNRTSPGVSFTGSYTLKVNQRVWVTKNALKFYDSFGFWPDFAVTGTLTNEVKPVSSPWPGGSLGDSGDVQLKDAVGNVLDRLVYGGYALPSSGWSGPTVYYYNLGGEAGQILARALDERTGLPITDTDTAADWIQYTGNYTTGRRVMYPGWDMDLFFWPYTSTMPATITLGVAPDNAFDVVSQALRSAQRSIEIEAYELKNYGVITEIVQQAWRGVSVTVLLEGEPASGVDNQERWACQEIEAALGQCWFMHTDSNFHIYDRYDLIHSKFIIIDRERLIVSTQNMSGGGMPDDDKADGTYGSRGYLLYIESPELAERAAQIFDRDLDPAHHNDIARWGAFGFVMPITPVVPITITGGTTSTVLFPTPQSVTDATHFELFTVPEAALRQSDALLGLVAQAQDGDEVYVEQMYEYSDWSDAPNLRLEAYLGAARRGAQVRILLNSGAFDQDYINPSRNITATAYVNEMARQEGLDLQARMGSPTRYGIHSKIVLVKLNNKGKAYSHVGSINGSEQSSKLNREIAVQVESQNLYTELARVFQADWNLAGPLFLPVVMRNYRAADHVVISEVLYDPYGSIDTGKEWIELYNPTGSAVDISDWSLGDAASDNEYGSGRYLFPKGTVLQPGGVIVVAQQAVSVTFKPDFEFVVVPALDDPTVPNMNTIVPTWDGFGLALGNQGDHVILLNAAGQLADAVVWGDASYPGTLPYSNEIWSDHSLERSPANRDTDDCAADFRDRYPSTPGALP